MFRALATASVRLLSYHARTSLNPVNYTLVRPPSFQSVLVLSTPSNLPKVIDEAVRLHQSSDVQIVVAGVDSLVPNSHRNGVAELWMKEQVTIANSVQVDERDDLKDAPKDSDGVNIVVARKNWKNIASRLRLVLEGATTTTIDLNLANTVFATGNLVTMFYLQPPAGSGEQANSGHTLCELTVRVPVAASAINTSDRLTPLYGPHDHFLVSDSVGNLVKKVNGQPASQFLENNRKLMDIASKDTEVYVKLYRANDPQKAYKHQVIAGGGGWGAKAAIIALSPDAKVANGDRIEFYMLTPQARWDASAGAVEVDEVRGKLAFEASFEQQHYEDSHHGAPAVLEGVFGCGSEDGFTIDGVGYNSAGERAVVTTG
ncbi:uncharacterized protein CANTADRAFT_87579 [Suhomyces tanzawaensis NRRL Y-17324]|uniref:FIST domain-containing protein n=1 Tax=Suhomyces tanzawaensis NRRL Y-17324 TaxID=984487 RepID=A0A1E4SQB5_9ASCO|nr:uncharacterized protein CANTADRAFT_87579 [Suhomyces tanzawaensis NRRL Y-17324]ODV81602.1 hypothetical protein CANTADRAFT_87579 [Suhomyces tanzawaensis NRRL Y-17324]